MVRDRRKCQGNGSVDQVGTDGDVIDPVQHHRALDIDQHLVGVGVEFTG